MTEPVHMGYDKEFVDKLSRLVQPDMMKGWRKVDTSSDEVGIGQLSILFPFEEEFQANHPPSSHSQLKRCVSGSWRLSAGAVA